MKTARLTDRALVRIDGEEATDFLQNLVTCDVETLAKGEATFGALLMPQGKILFDFFCMRTTDGYLFDINAGLAADFIKRMTFYKLRAPVDIAAVDDGRAVYAIWEGNPDNDSAFIDPRLTAMGWRVFAVDTETNASLEDYHTHRIVIGMPQGGLDYTYGEVFPHDAMMDQFEASGAGVAFEKGCYVGQEVVSRMKHRGTARKRVVHVSAETELPPTGAAVESGGKTIGTLGSICGKFGLAMMRIDRLADALSDDNPVTIKSIEVVAKLPDWADIALAGR